MGSASRAIIFTNEYNNTFLLKGKIIIIDYKKQLEDCVGLFILIWLVINLIEDREGS